MDILGRLVQRATEFRKRIVYPEGSDPRVIQAAEQAARTGICEPSLLGNPDHIHTAAQKNGFTLKDIQVVDPGNSSWFRELADLYYEIRKSRGIQKEEAQREALEPLNFGALMVRANMSDGMVAGARHTTAETLRSAIRIIGPAPGMTTV